MTVCGASVEDLVFQDAKLSVNVVLGPGTRGLSSKGVVDFEAGITDCIHTVNRADEAVVRSLG
jgi:hypothetical protein